ncbi:acetyltransferase [Vibrio cholerae]|nr:acetyltransferase [Vibrio cholerae]
MVSAVVFEFSGMRCQPLRRALCILSISLHEIANYITFI